VDQIGGDMKKHIPTSEDAITSGYGLGERVEVCTINGALHLVLGDRKVAINDNAGIISIPGNPYAGTFASLAGAADWVFTEDDLPFSRIPSVRRDFLDLDDDGRLRLAMAFNHIHSLGWIDAFARMHEDAWPSPSVGGWSAHFTPQFLPWHRWMVREMEKKMQRFDPLVTIPYWDSTRPEANDWDGPMLGDFFGGENNSGGNFNQWDIVRSRVEGLSSMLPTLSDVWGRLRQSRYIEMRGLEAGPIHVGAHNWVGGYMAAQGSPKDPLFYLHHANVDRIWALWQLNNPDVFPQYDPQRALSDFSGYDASGIDDRLFVPRYVSGSTTTPTVRDVLNHRALGYRYAHDQRLEDFSESRPGGPLISGDPQAFTIAPHRIEAETGRGSWKISTFQLINDTNFSVEIDIERFPENSQGQVDGFVWLPLHVTLQPQDSHDHFVVFAPQGTGLYNFRMKVRVDPVGPGSPIEITVPVIGSSTW